jgi:hypothetical protein
MWNPWEGLSLPSAPATRPTHPSLREASPPLPALWRSRRGRGPKARGCGRVGGGSREPGYAHANDVEPLGGFVSALGGRSEPEPVARTGRSVPAHRKNWHGGLVGKAAVVTCARVGSAVFLVGELDRHLGTPVLVEGQGDAGALALDQVHRLGVRKPHGSR